MPLDIDSAPPSHYECVVLADDRNFVIEGVKQSAYNYMDQLEGWCTYNKASLLMDFVFMLEPKTVVEIGVFGGKSLIPMAAALRSVGKGKVYGIDPWSHLESMAGMDGENLEWWGQLDHEQILQGLIAKINQFGLEEQIVLLRSTSELAPSIPNIDILHIDGNHSEKAANLDVNKWVPLVRKGGIIIFDDVTWGTNKRAVEWLDDNCIRFVEFHDMINDWAVWIKA